MVKHVVEVVAAQPLLAVELCLDLVSLVGVVALFVLFLREKKGGCCR